jgi:hypothetical protein
LLFQRTKRQKVSTNERSHCSPKLNPVDSTPARERKREQFGRFEPVLRPTDTKKACRDPVQQTKRHSWNPKNLTKIKIYYHNRNLLNPRCRMVGSNFTKSHGGHGCILRLRQRQSLR